MDASTLLGGRSPTCACTPWKQNLPQGRSYCPNLMTCLYVAMRLKLRELHGLSHRTFTIDIACKPTATSVSSSPTTTCGSGSNHDTSAFTSSSNESSDNVCAHRSAPMTDRKEAQAQPKSSPLSSNSLSSSSSSSSVPITISQSADSLSLSEDSTGAVIWGPSVLLTVVIPAIIRHSIANNITRVNPFWGRSVMELGAGGGLASFVMACCGSYPVIATDRSLSMLHYNIDAMRSSSTKSTPPTNESSSSSASLSSIVETKGAMDDALMNNIKPVIHSWGQNLDSLNEYLPVDILLMADVLNFSSCHTILWNSIQHIISHSPSTLVMISHKVRDYENEALFFAMLAHHMTIYRLNDDAPYLHDRQRYLDTCDPNLELLLLVPSLPSSSTAAASATATTVVGSESGETAASPTAINADARRAHWLLDIMWPYVTPVKKH
jgi:predicted nicotinamide N-methyase